MLPVASVMPTVLLLATTRSAKTTATTVMMVVGRIGMTLWCPVPPIAVGIIATPNAKCAPSVIDQNKLKCGGRHKSKLLFHCAICLRSHQKIIVDLSKPLPFMLTHTDDLAQHCVGIAAAEPVSPRHYRH